MSQNMNLSPVIVVASIPSVLKQKLTTTTPYIQQDDIDCFFVR